MDKENQRIAFLQHLGWTELNRDSKLGNYRALRGISPSGVKNQIAPNPLTNLNVIHEAWLKIPEELKLDFYHELQSACSDDGDTMMGRFIIGAGPEQRLEAYLKTLNLWTYER